EDSRDPFQIPDVAAVTVWPALFEVLRIVSDNLIGNVARSVRVTINRHDLAVALRFFPFRFLPPIFRFSPLPWCLVQVEACAQHPRVTRTCAIAVALPVRLPLFPTESLADVVLTLDRIVAGRV